MLQKLKSLYLKARVLEYAGKKDTLEPTMIQMTKETLLNPSEYFLQSDNMEYYRVRFVAYGVKNWSVNQAGWGPSELERYSRGLEQIKKYEELQDFLNNMYHLFWEVRNLHLNLSREESTINFWDKRGEATPQFMEQLRESMHKYLSFMEQIKENKDWQEKVKMEVGYYIHFMYNTLCTSENYEFFKDFVILFTL